MCKLDQVLKTLEDFSMDHSPFRKNLGIRILTSTAGKSTLNLLNCEVWLQNIVRCGKYSPVKFANFVYFCIMRGILKSDFEMRVHFSAHNTKVYKIRKLHRTRCFPRFTMFCNQTLQVY